MNGNLPKDPVMLLSYVNMQLRDNYASLKEFCSSFDLSEEELKEKLAAMEYIYSERTNQFV